MGNLTRDPELKNTPNGQAVANFGVATNRRWTTPEGDKRDEVEFHNLVVWGRQAEVINQYMKKGNPIFIEGRLKTQNWEGQDGVRRSRTEIVVESFQFIGSAGGRGDNSSAGGSMSGNDQSQSNGDFNYNQNTMPVSPADAAAQGNLGANSGNQSGGGAEAGAPKLDDDINIEDIPF